MAVIIYCKDHHRRPIQFGYSAVFRDVQGEIPPGWCSVCGCEIFEYGQSRCIRCRKRKENAHE